ncbi:hypothetical protein KDN24_06190 [Bacillus sp. Bva_UNVM-123]|uniref:hypothetical protein n=1 Tax=Bacillus sp. Bva_UNVM-123 TaxID=2829798 RepID=UPI00391F8BB7
MKVSQQYYNTLKNKLFKILCLFEEKNHGLTQFIDSLIYELYGLQYLIENDKYDSITSIIAILEHFYDDSLQSEVSIGVIRREVFHCMDLIQKLIKDGENK